MDRMVGTHVTELSCFKRSYFGSITTNFSVWDHADVQDGAFYQCRHSETRALFQRWSQRDVNKRTNPCWSRCLGKKKKKPRGVTCCGDHVSIVHHFVSNTQRRKSQGLKRCEGRCFCFLHKSARNGCLIFVSVPPALVPNVSRCV